MNFEILLENIKAEYSLRKLEIENEYSKKIDALRADLASRKIELREKKISRKKDELDNFFRKDTGSEKIHVKKELMDRKASLVDSAIENGIEQLMQSGGYMQFLESELMNHPHEIVFGNKDDAALKACASKLGRAVSPAQIKGGIIFFNDKAKVYTNKSIDAAIEKNRSSIERDVLNTLL